MQTKRFVRLLSLILAICLTVGMLPPVTAFAAENETVETEPTVETTAPAETTVPAEEPAETTEAPTEAPAETTVPAETTAPEETTVPEETTAPTEAPAETTEPVAALSEETESETEDSEYLVNDYDTLYTDLRRLYTYAKEYAEANPEGMTTNELMLNYVRTGYAEYTTAEWTALTGEENTDFAAYVVQRDTEKKTHAADLRSVNPSILTPNGITLDFPMLVATTEAMYLGKIVDVERFTWHTVIGQMMQAEYAAGVRDVEDVDALAAQLQEKYLISGEIAEDLTMSAVAFAMSCSMRTSSTATLYSQVNSKFKTLDPSYCGWYLSRSRFIQTSNLALVSESVYNAYMGYADLTATEAGLPSDELESLRAAVCKAFALELLDDYKTYQAIYEKKQEENEEDKESTSSKVDRNDTIYITDYESFLTNLKQLEIYADEYAAANDVADVTKMLLMYIRCGNSLYTTADWTTMAGTEDAGFKEYVAAMDEANGTTAGYMRGIQYVMLPNGERADPTHMIALMNIAYMSPQATADMGGWAGDLSDMLYNVCKNYNKRYKRANAEDTYANMMMAMLGPGNENDWYITDFRADADAYYLLTQVKNGMKLSEACENYYTEELSPSDRYYYFVVNRFPDVYTREELGDAIYKAYSTNLGIQILEAEDGLTEKTEERKMVCDLYADWLYSLIGNELDEYADTAVVTDYATFLARLKELEPYAESYAASNGEDANELILNFIRTGVEKYNDSDWQIMAGVENTGFVSYVSEMDSKNGTHASDLRKLKGFYMPNGERVDFAHMIAALNIAYVGSQTTADMSGWAGDLCDLLRYTNEMSLSGIGNQETIITNIRENYLGVRVHNGFSIVDIRGDLDAYYLNDQLKSSDVKFSALIERYFVDSLSMEQRAAYFLNNRFSGALTQEAVRTAVYDAYKSNMGLRILEADRGLSALNELRTVCCYAFADYLFELAGDQLEGGEIPDETTPDETTPDETLPDETTPEETVPEENVVTADRLNSNDLYSDFSATTTTLAPGIFQTIKYAYTADDKQIAYYVATVDVNRDDVAIYANYKDNDPSKGWGMQRVLDQMLAAQENRSDPTSDKYIENYNVIVGINADGFNMSTGQPSGALIMNGVTYSSGSGRDFFAVLKDGTVMIGSAAEYEQYEDQIQEAVSCFANGLLVRDGKIVAQSDSSYYLGRASRTCIGITADGQVIMMVLDGRQEPFSAGGTLAELAQIMYDLGCVDAINLDGGGSSTFVAKAEGADNVAVVNNPSDGYARSVSSSLVVVSTAYVSTEFDHAKVTSDYNYLTVGTQLPLTAVGVSETGHSAEVPSNAKWQVSDTTIGTVDSSGVFTAKANGTVEVQLLLDGNVVGSKKLQVVIPDALSFEKASMNAIYGMPLELKLSVTYKGNPVAFNDGDVLTGLDYPKAATMEGLTVTAIEGSGLRRLTVAAALTYNDTVYTTMTLALYSADEAYFDFENATGGDETLAWDREVTNSISYNNEQLIHILDVDEEMVVNYTFGIDMAQIRMPEKLEALAFMLPGSDASNASAWNFMLQLAERISVLTEVTITVQFDEDMDVDYSGMKLSNEYFYLKSTEMDENNLMTIHFGWIDQTQAVDPSTANSICILSGIKLTPREDAPWDSEDQIQIANVGQVDYDVYLRTHALYSFSANPANQEEFGLYPFINEDVILYDEYESGGHFMATYAQFEDSFTMDRTDRQGWYMADDCLYYFVDNVAMTGVHMLPSYEDPSVEYYYHFDENGILTGKHTGLFEMDGFKYYAVQGRSMTGWRVVNSENGREYYYFDLTTGQALDGQQTIDGYNYTFTDCVLTRGDLVTNANGGRYMWAGSWVSQQWLDIDGNVYYATMSSYFATGLQYRYSPEGDWTYYAFDENGVWMQDFTGVYEWQGGVYLINEGIVDPYPGLFWWNDGYYYITSTHVMIKDRDYWISKTNGIIPEGSYHFDENGRLDVEIDLSKSGIVEEDGSLYYYENGVRAYKGLILIRGYYYYVKSSGEVVNNCSYWISKTNGLLPEGSYKFDEYGRITNAPELPGDKQNGIVAIDDTLYYLVNGVPAYAGLIEIDGEYYYVRTSGELVWGRSYWISKTNGLLPERSYSFDENGRIIDVPVNSEDSVTQTKNGIVAENGSLFYYVAGVRTFAGLIEIDGEYYYVRTSGELVQGRSYYITKTNGLLPEGKYNFDDSGKLRQ